MFSARLLTTEKLSETCRVLFQKWIWEISASHWFYYNISRCTVLWMPNCYWFQQDLGWRTCQESQSPIWTVNHELWSMEQCRVTKTSSVRIKTEQKSSLSIILCMKETEIRCHIALAYHNSKGCYTVWEVWKATSMLQLADHLYGIHQTVLQRLTACYKRYSGWFDPYRNSGIWSRKNFNPGHILSGNQTGMKWTEWEWLAYLRMR